jgi:hypothetical protein
MLKVMKEIDKREEQVQNIFYKEGGGEDEDYFGQLNRNTSDFL